MCVLISERARARASFQVKLMYNVFLSLFLENEDLCGVMSYSSLALLYLHSSHFILLLIIIILLLFWPVLLRLYGAGGAYVEQTNHLTELIGICNLN